MPPSAKPKLPPAGRPQWIFTGRLPLDVVEDLAQQLPLLIPGVWTKAGPSRGAPTTPTTSANGDQTSFITIGAGVTAVALLTAELQRRNIDALFKINAPTIRQPPVAYIMPREMRKDAPPLMAHQLEGLRLMSGRSGMLSWSCGAGKTPAGISWALEEPGLAIVVTRAPARIQWAREIRRWSTASVLVMESGCLKASLNGDGSARRNILYSDEQLLVLDGPRARRHDLWADGETAAAIARLRYDAGGDEVGGPDGAGGSNVGPVIVAALTAGGAVTCRVEAAWRCRVVEKLGAAGTSAAGKRVRVAIPKGAVDTDGSWRTKPKPGYVLSLAADASTPTVPLPRFIVLGWQGLPAFVGMLESLKPVSVVGDESSTIKGHKRWDPIYDPAGGVTFKAKTNITASAMRLRKAARRALGMSATIIKDRVRDLWGQLDFVMPGEFGPFYKWAGRFAGMTTNSWGGLDTTGSSNEEELAARLAIVRHHVTKSDLAAALPAMRRSVVYLLESDLDDLDMAEWRPDVQAAASSGPGALKQLELMMSAARKHSYIVDRVIEAMASGQKVIVFTGRRRDCDALGAAIAKAVGGGATSGRGGRAAIPDAVVVTFHGGTTMVDRQAMVDEFMGSPGAAALVATGDCAGEALNLQKADLLINAMLPWTPGQIIQREGRAVRIGRSDPVLILYPIAEGTYEEHVAGALINKLPAVETVVKSEEVAGLADVLAVGDDIEAVRSKALATILGIEDVDALDDD